MEAKHKEYEDVLSFMAATNLTQQTEHDPREDGEGEGPPKTTESYVTMESLSALGNFAPGLIEHQCGGDKHVTMYKDEKQGGMAPK